MDSVRLSFADLYFLGDGIAEVIADEGINVSVEMYEELLEAFGAHTPKPTKLLANRKNSYSFSFQAMQFANNSNAIEAVAVLERSSISRLVSRFAKPKHYRMKSFDNRDDAIAWLMG